MIEVRGLTKSYGPYRAINGLNFSVNKGEVVGFLGPNGAGKTTTMKIITGFMAPSAGEVKVAGYDVFADPIEVKKRIGYLPENPPVYMDMTVQEYLAFVAGIKQVPKDKIAKMVDRALEKTNLGEVRKRLIQNLSKGFRQRVGISQALVSDPEVLILDEPTVGLDPKQVAEIRNLIKELSGQHTIILSTHILPEVQASCQRVIIINRGSIVAEDTLEGLSRRMVGGRRVQVRVRRGADALADELRKQNGVISVRPISATEIEVDVDDNDEVVERLATIVVNKNLGLLEMRSALANLEDIFIKLTSTETKPAANGVSP
jgi:ABC-2 type transport system ATP-binding protein